MSKRRAVVPVGPGIAYLPLTKGQWALVDLADVWVGEIGCWHAKLDPSVSRFYAVRNHRVAGRTVTSYLHRLLMPAVVAGDHVDHRNGNSLDNRRANLRIASASTNAFNQAVSRNNRSGVKGVCRRADGKFQAAITVRRRRIYLGCFSNLDEARSVRLSAERQHFGSFARPA